MGPDRGADVAEPSGRKAPMAFFLCVVGMVMIVEGTPYFAFPDKMKAMMRQILQVPDGALRRWGLGLMLAGLALVWLGRHGGP
jgi:uncharacterized protein YjeT (DUF2065 family)